MRALVTVARREILDRRMVLAAAAVAGLIPLFTPLLPGVRDAAAAREAGALFLVAAFGWGSAILLGASAVGRDLFEKRLGFYFARPLSGGAIWWGKLLGTWGLATGALLLATLPTAVVNGGFFTILEQGRKGHLAIWALAVGGTLFLVPLAHVVGLAMRSRSPWIAFDVAALVAVAAVIWISGRTILRSGALEESLGWVLLAALVAVLASFLLAGLAGVALGRTDARRGHRIVSTTLWSLLGAMALGLSGYALLVAYATPASLNRVINISASPKGGWLLVDGRAHGRGFPSFLLNSEDGRYLKMETGTWIPTAAFSRDGRRVAWLRSVPFSGNLSPELFWADLVGEPKPVRIDLGSHTGAWSSGLALSPDGGRLAFVDAGLLSVFDLDTARIVVSVRLGLPVEERPVEVSRIQLFFPSSDRVRVLAQYTTQGERERRTIVLRELNVPAKDLEVTGQFDVKTLKPVTPSLSTTGDRMLLTAGNEALSLRDGRTGALISPLALPEGKTLRSLAFLSSGRIAVVSGTATDIRLLLFSQQGALERNLPLGPGRRAQLAGEMEPGKLLVGICSVPLGMSRGRWADGRGWKTFVVDEVTGRLTPHAEGLAPVGGRPFWRGATIPPVNFDSSLATRLFADEAGRLIRVEGGSRRVVTGS